MSRFIPLLLALLVAGFAPKVSSSELRALSTFVHLNEPIYVAAIYTQENASDPEGWLNSKGNRSMELRFIPARLSSRMFARVFLERILVNNAPDDVASYQSELQQILTFIRQDYRRGDRIRFDAPAKGSLTMKVNGSVVAEIKRPGFFNLLLRGWVGEKLKLQNFYRELVSPVAPALEQEFAELSIADGRQAWAKEMIGNKPSLTDSQVAENSTPEPKVQSKPKITPKKEVEAPKPKPQPKQVVSKPVQKEVTKPKPAVTETKKEVSKPKEEDEEPPVAQIAALNPLLEDLKSDYLIELKNAIETRATPRPPRTLRKVSRDDLVAQVTVNREGQVTNVAYASGDFPDKLKDAVTDELNRLTTLPTPPEVLVEKSYTVETIFNFGKCKRPAAVWICF
ncbi:MAG: chalcone isomerase family protein [Gammaproteobacteria bacterium]|nr:chalcone isomerase family protein [Gammaproteobacteria bacterium]